MKKFLKILLIIIVIPVVVILVGALFMPKETALEETVLIKADTEVIFDYVNCLKKTTLWAPWEGIGEQSFSGPECGLGAIQEWVMEDGSVGKQEIIESTDLEYVKTFLDFGPMGTADAEIKLEAADDGTKVTWTFRSDATYPHFRWMNLLFNVENSVRESYKKGLNSLDSIILNLPPDVAGYDIATVIDLESFTMLSIRELVSMENIGPKMGEFYGKIMMFIEENQLKMKEYPIAIWHSWSDIDNDMECAVFVEGEAEGTDMIKSSKSYAGKAVVLDYYGAYDATPEGWQKITEFIQENDLEENGKPWDAYITDPMLELDTAKWLTRLYQPVKLR